MSIAEKMAGFIEPSSWIRKMFEEGARMKSIHGKDNVYDFSLGNPCLNPPNEFKRYLKSIVENDVPGVHAYMPNTGYPHVRKAVAEYLGREQGMALDENDVVMTCGAAGGLNIILKAIVNPGDEIITPAPYFVEYGFYVDNHGGKLVTVKSGVDFNLDLDAIEQAIGEKTKAILINSPNNPTGQIYPEESLKMLGDLLRRKSGEQNRTIYLISDEPYRKITYDGIEVPSVFKCYDNSFVATSYSKDLSIPGERIGYVAVSPNAQDKGMIIQAMALANRILGFVNAPALMQRVIGGLQGQHVDISEYARKREILCNGLSDFGYRFQRPAGAFYLFPQSPIPDEVAFIKVLQEERILAVPGRGFGAPGYFRLSFCVDDRTITDSLPGFERAFKQVGA
jgi:aspartate aminotransferase